jgi:hypothetical protein
LARRIEVGNKPARDVMLTALRRLTLALAAMAALAIVLATAPADAARRGNAWPYTLSPSNGHNVYRLQFGDAKLIVSYTPSEFQLTQEEIAEWVLRSARATATYFGRFPVGEVHVTIEAARGDDVVEGLAWTTPAARIRIVVGRQTAARTLKRDTTLVHEMTHLAFPDLEESHLWLHEGIATYVEAVASAQADEMTAAELWAHFVEEMPQGLPEKGDKGLDDTPSYDRRYWGGAMFCLVADVEIRRRTNNRYGLKDSLRAILQAGGNLATTWEVERALGVGDAAVGVTVLEELYAGWRNKSVAPDLKALWQELGVRPFDDGVQLADTAPLAAIRRAITQPPAEPMLLVAPQLIHEATQPQ